MKKSLFSEGVCRADNTLGIWTADVGEFCMLIRDKYACWTAGTCECAPASQVEAMHSMYTLTMSGIPSPPQARGVCITSATLSLPVADPRKPRVRLKTDDGSHARTTWFDVDDASETAERHDILGSFWGRPALGLWRQAALDA